MINSLVSLVFMLAQNAIEKRLTIIGVAIFGAFLLFLIMDSLAKGNFVPKKGPIRGFLIFLFIIVIVVFILLMIYYK